MIVKEAIQKILADSWSINKLKISGQISEAIDTLQELIRLDDYYQNESTNPEQLAKSIGGFGSGLIDVNAFAVSFSNREIAKGIGEDRKNSIMARLHSLTEYREKIQKGEIGPTIVENLTDFHQLGEAFDAHMSSFSEIFAHIRATQFERKAELTDRREEYLKYFTWRDFNDDEYGLVPVFSVLFEDLVDIGAVVINAFQLAHLRKPIKLIFTRSDGAVNLSSLKGRELALSSGITLEMLPFILRQSYFLQCVVSGSDLFQDNLLQACNSSRPAIISIPISEQQSHEAEKKAWLDDFLAARVCPQFSYDPDRATDFVSCIELIKNGNQKSDWGKIRTGEDTKEVVTYAEYIIKYGKFSAPLEVPNEVDNTLHISKYLRASATDRGKFSPIAEFTSADGSQKRFILNKELVNLAAQKLQVWNTLQELSGIKNPYIKAAELKVKEESEKELKKALGKQKDELLSLAKENEKTLLHGAMRNLASNLVSLVSNNTSVGGLTEGVSKTSTTEKEVESPKSVSAEKPVQKKEVSDEPWIESAECTSCDDCITINNKIFAYNKDKKSYIKDPRGGSYKDIVKAAEKCPARVIHPGKPLDPNEKKLEKWIKRAEPFM